MPKEGLIATRIMKLTAKVHKPEAQLNDQQCQQERHQTQCQPPHTETQIALRAGQGLKIPRESQTLHGCVSRTN
jgi:hypothetical protein